jgi:eukaryotic-like serine/threonine-protein kinase
MSNNNRHYKNIIRAIRNRSDTTAPSSVRYLVLAIVLLLTISTLAIALVLVGLPALGWPQVPNFSGLPIDHAVYYLAQYELAYKIADQEVGHLDEAGLVLSQAPRPGLFLLPGKQVLITVGRYYDVEPDEDTEMLTPTNSSPTSTLVPVFVTTTLTPDIPLYPTETMTPEPLPTATESGPTPQGGGGEQLAYASKRNEDVQIWSINLDGTNMRQLTFIEGGACQPAWSPDGLHIVFVSPCAGHAESHPGSALRLINADGSNLEGLPSAPGGDYDPQWSPDGTMIAFTSIRDDGRGQIFMLNMTDSTVRNHSENSGHELQPAWSPEGTQLAFMSPSSVFPTIRICNLTNREIIQFSHDDDKENSLPAWSPDGSMIVYNQISGLPRLVGATLDENGYNAEILFPANPMPMRDASFSADGNWIAFESWPDGVNHGIWIAMMGAGQILQVTDDAFENFDAAWRP